MRYAPKEWKAVAVLMRDSTYSVLEAVEGSPKTWTELKKAANLTDGGLQKVLTEMLKRNLVEDVFVKEKSEFKVKKYAISEHAKKEKIYKKAKELKKSLEKVAVSK
ncbi:MAG: hypothetical protein GOV02_02670 [Candidatus Aenigmarchaeota archaeon]|nr:hypothetical protein [Candidatus Aenigmarchaeota archaeon]